MPKPAFLLANLFFIILLFPYHCYAFDDGDFQYWNRENADSFWRYRNKITIKFPLKSTKFEIQPYLADEIFVDFDQEELMQLLIKEIVVYPFDPAKDRLPKDSLGVFKTKIRTKWFKVKMKLYEILDITTRYNNSPDSSDSKKVGSVSWTKYERRSQFHNPL